MTNLNFIAGIIIIIAAAAIIGIRVYQNSKKNGGKMTMDDFIDSYGDDIIKALQRVIGILKIDMKDYETQADYESAIITSTINSLKDSSMDFGIPVEVVDLFDTEALASIILKVMNEHKPDAFSVLDSETIKENENLLDEEVVEVLGSATED